MDFQLNSAFSTLCVACLSSERKLHLLDNHETKQMYSALLDKFDINNYTIPLCYECVSRLKSTIRFKKQVLKAHQLLSELTNHNAQPTSLSKLSIIKTATFEWEPDPTIFTSLDPFRSNFYKVEERSNQNCNSSLNIHSDSHVSDDDTDFEVLNPTSDVGQFKNHNKYQKGNKYELDAQHSYEIDTWDVKVENVIQKTDVDVKEEPSELKCKDNNDMNEEMRSVTKYEFDDSDDEPLTAKKLKKKKAVKEQTRERPPGVVSGVWVQKKLQQLNVPSGQLEMVVLSWEEVEQERQKSLTSVRYTRHEFRCPSCVVGFNHRFKLEAHMKKHASDAGDLECSICKSRFKTQSSLLCHRRRHRSRWRCCTCRAVFSRAPVAADHVSRTHGAPHATHACRVCAHHATSLGKLRVHMKSHSERQHCEQCGKTFKDKSSLRTHLYIHTNQMDFSCAICEKKFRFKKALEIHSITHQASELLYCAECDMNFKNRLSFYQHINYSMKHIHPDKIKYACEFCPRRFSKPARLEEHRLSIHLKLAPHKCTVEGCTFASASRPALRTHNRMVHRNKRLERNHVCHTCGKAYTTKKILEGHIRSHTGERPFVCTKCPATFSHDAALYNHNKLVHKTPFVRRRKPNPQLVEDQLNWDINVGPTISSDAAPEP